VRQSRQRVPISKFNEHLAFFYTERDPERAVHSLQLIMPSSWIDRVPPMISCHVRRGATLSLIADHDRCQQLLARSEEMNTEDGTGGAVCILSLGITIL